jgi:hypothetical protein
MAAAIAAALSYRDGLQAFTISADELAGRWSTARPLASSPGTPNSRPRQSRCLYRHKLTGPPAGTPTDAGPVQRRQPLKGAVHDVETDVSHGGMRERAGDGPDHGKTFPLVSPTAERLDSATALNCIPAYPRSFAQARANRHSAVPTPRSSGPACPPPRCPMLASCSWTGHRRTSPPPPRFPARWAIPEPSYLPARRQPCCTGGCHPAGALDASTVAFGGGPAG